MREGQGEAVEESAAATAAFSDVRESNSGSGRETKAVAHWAGLGLASAGLAQSAEGRSSFLKKIAALGLIERVKIVYFQATLPNGIRTSNLNK